MNRPSLRLGRREFLASGLLGTIGWALSPHAKALTPAPESGPRAQRCILIWLAGGPSHIDTFDPKPRTPTGGPFSAIETEVPGIQLAEHLPGLAKRAKKLAIVRSLTSPEADHDRATTLLHTGQRPQEAVEYPSIGSIVARRWSADEGILPGYVSIGGMGAPPGFYGLDFAPYVLGDPSNPFQNVGLPEGVSERRQTRRLVALDAFNADFARRGDARVVGEFSRLNSRARRLMKPGALDALDLNQLSESETAYYGIRPEPTPEEGESTEAPNVGNFARSCILARRLIESGVRFVEVELGNWDTHDNNFDTVKDLSAELDPGLSGLLDDLESRGLLGDTLVICMGEFGRTPAINPQAGRDHWNQAFSAVLAGGGVRGGQVIGATDAQGALVKDRPVSIPDLFATLLQAFGVDTTRPVITPEGRPIKLIDGGKVVDGLLA
ncbi:MAG: DUF1501 domain-containing protein [Isosphaeraceae bacterium]